MTLCGNVSLVEESVTGFHAMLRMAVGRLLSNPGSQLMPRFDEYVESFTDRACA